MTPTDWPFFSERHRRLAPAFRSWAAAHLGRFECDEGGDGVAARDIFGLLAGADWLRVGVSDDGQQGKTHVDLRLACLMREALAYSSAVADVALSEPWLAALPIALYGSDDQKRRLLGAYASGRCLPAFALSEPEAGSDVAALRTTAIESGTGYVIDGRKTWTSNSGLADVYVVFARTDGSGPRGISAFVVNGDHAGVTLEQRLCVLSPHTVGTLRFDHCRVEADSLLGQRGLGFEVAMRALELFRTTVGAATLGMARRAMDEALRRSTERVAFGKAIAEHQLIQAKLADMAVKIDAAALLVYRSAWCHDIGKPTAREAAIAKLYSSEMAQQVVDEALQIFGGLGVVRGTVVERLYRHVRAFRIFDGTSEIQRLIIAKQVLNG